ncbi:HIT domain-containing protein [Candidatus Collierbacteria bacterium]|nr:HIT domain-containing protein [Candidatus Collierbacteria bacterium]
MSDCIFCLIVSGQIPCHKVFENEHFLGFLDISPVVEGHALVIPKKHFRWVHEVEEFGEFWEAAQKVGQAQINGLKAATVVFATAGFQVPHAHIHVMPCLAVARKGEGGPMPLKQKGEYLPGVESAKRINMSPSQLQEVAAKLRNSVK